MQQQEEKVLFRGSSSAVINVGTFTLCALLATGSVAGAIVAPPPVHWILFGVAGFTVVFALIRWWLIRTRVYELTTERIRITSGIITRRTEELELYRVRDATLVEPPLARLFGLGTIVVTTTDASTPAFQMPYLPRVRDLREQLRQSIELCRERKRVRVAELE